jgi:hypothetical protein
MHIPTVIATLRAEARIYGQEAHKMAVRISEGETKFEAHRQECQITTTILEAVAKALEYGTDERAINVIKARNG